MTVLRIPGYMFLRERKQKRVTTCHMPGRLGKDSVNISILLLEKLMLREVERLGQTYLVSMYWDQDPNPGVFTFKSHSASPSWLPLSPN